MKEGVYGNRLHTHHHTVTQSHSEGRGWEKRHERTSLAATTPPEPSLCETAHVNAPPPPNTHTHTHTHWVPSVTKLRLKFNEDTRDLTHFWFLQWPDHGVPRKKDGSLAPYPVLAFVTRVLRHPASGPILWHCSAGVGRSGAAVALAHGMDSFDRGDNVDLVHIIATLRQDRVAQVQTVKQYELVQEALILYAQGKKQSLELSEEATVSTDWAEKKTEEMPVGRDSVRSLPLRGLYVRRGGSGYGCEGGRGRGVWV